MRKTLPRRETDLKSQRPSTLGLRVEGRLTQAPVVKGVKIDSLEKAYQVFEGRALNQQELKAVAPVFQNLLDLDQIKVHEIPRQILDYIEGPGTGGAAHSTFPNDIGISQGTPFERYNTSQQATAGHELVHTYQFHGGKSNPSGESIFGSGVGGDIKRKYDYGDAEQLKARRADGYRFPDMSPEQQGRLVEDYINLVQAPGLENEPTPYRTSMLGALQPYIDDLRASPSYGRTGETAAKAKLEAAVAAVKKGLSDIRRGDFKSLKIF